MKKETSQRSVEQAQQVLGIWEGLELLKNAKDHLRDLIAEALDAAFLEGVDCERSMRRLEDVQRAKSSNEELRGEA